MVGKKLAFASITGATAVAMTGYYYRPVGDNADDTSGPKRIGVLISKDSLCDRANLPPPILYSVASSIVIFTTTAITRTFMYCGGKFEVEEDKNYANFINRVKQRDPGVPLITVSTSTLAVAYIHVYM
jgi:hypothetical protein